MHFRLLLLSGNRLNRWEEVEAEDVIVVVGQASRWPIGPDDHVEIWNDERKVGVVRSASKHPG